MLNVTGLSQSQVDSYAHEIHDEYMEVFGDRGAVTVSLLKLGQIRSDGTNSADPLPWSHFIRYFGPESSVAWLEQKIATVAARESTAATTQTFTVSDVTGRY